MAAARCGLLLCWNANLIDGIRRVEYYREQDNVNERVNKIGENQ
jgi:hypothetical protein